MYSNLKPLECSGALKVTLSSGVHIRLNFALPLDQKILAKFWTQTACYFVQERSTAEEDKEERPLS